MSSSSRRVVLTGIGALTPIGLDANAFWKALDEGQSGVHTIKSFDTGELSTRFGGQVTGFDAKNYIDKKERKNLRVMARAIQLAVSAAQLALDSSKIDKEKLDPTRFGVEFGAGLLPSELIELAPAAVTSANCQPGVVDLKRWGEQGLAAITPLWMLKYLPNMLACHVSIMHNAQGPNNSITESDVAGLLALGEACRILRRDQADFMLVGGADSKMNPLSMVRQCLFGHLSRRNDAPEKASRPFDRQRDGLVVGEGAGVLAIEDLEHATKRGADIFCEITGFGAAFDRSCTGKGLARAMRAALKQAQVTPADIDHVNAHGLSTIASDAWEAKAIADVFGANAIPVWAVKSAIGNTAAGSGPIELAASALAMRHGVVPATLNCDEVDPSCPVAVTREKTPVRKPYFMKLGFTEMGQAAAVVCRKWD